jgi:putative ABC transport system substrate-binding protein
MHLRALWTLAVLGVFVIPFLAVAADSRVHRVGYLLARGPDARIDEAFFGKLRDLGYEEGRNVVIERRFAEGRFERLPQLAQELVDLKIDVIVAAPFPAAQAAKRGTTTVPVVMLTGGDPVAAGFVASLARPGGNVTGVSNEATGANTKMLEILKDFIPAAQMIAVLINPNNKHHIMYRERINEAALVLGVKLIHIEATSVEEFAAVIRDAKEKGAEGLVVVPGPVLLNHRAELIKIAARERLPLIAPFREFVVGGALASYGPNLADGFRRMAVYVDKILRGADPATLPVELPTTFELILNLKTARALDLTLPPGVVVRADDVIQ